MTIRKATAKDIDAVEKLYDAIHTAEEIEGMPEDETNVLFYEKHGFQRMAHGAAIQICNYSDKR